MKNRGKLELTKINRFSDNELVIGFHFNRNPTNTELGILHDVMKAAVDGLNEGTEIVETGGDIEASEKLFAATKGQKPN